MSTKPPRRLWVTVWVQRGVESEARLYAEETRAAKQMAIWRRKMNPDYDAVFTLPVSLPLEPKLTPKHRSR